MIKSILRVLLIVLLLLLPRLAFLAFAEDPKPTTPGPACGAMDFKAGEIIVKFKESVSPASVRSLLLAEKIDVLREMDKLGLTLLSVPQGRELEKIEELKRNPLVEYAEPNYIVQIADISVAEPHNSLRAPEVVPNDPYFLSQWNLSGIEAPAAWDITTGSDKVIIAVIGTGASLAHPELKDKIWTNHGETPGNGIDDDGNDFVDDVHGWDFVNWHGAPQDDYGHGTFVTGIASAETNNGILIAGVSWGAEIMPVKVLDRDGYGSIADVSGGILYAADNGARIINLSFTLTGSAYSNAVQNVVNHAHSKGALVIAAAGDSSDDSYQYPAALDHVVSVAATDREDERWRDSTYNDRVDIAAPGDEIYSFWEGGEGQISSTHMAAPQVSGLAALIWSVNPRLAPDQVEDLIESKAVDLGESGRDDYFGHGRIDSAAAVMATPHYLEVEPDSLDFLVYDNGYSPSQTITNPNTNSSTWTATATAPWLSISPPEGYTPSSATVSIDVGSLPDYGVYTTTITATSTLTHCVNCSQPITVTVVYRCRSYLPLVFKES
jgi:subtilisin family serine protease